VGAGTAPPAACRMGRPVEATRGEHLLGIDAKPVTTIVVVAAFPPPVVGLWLPTLPMNQHTILLLAANPAAMPRLNVDDEARDIRIALQQNGHGDAFKLEVWPAARTARPARRARHAGADGGPLQRPWRSRRGRRQRAHLRWPRRHGVARRRAARPVLPGTRWPATVSCPRLRSRRRSPRPARR